MWITIWNFIKFMFSEEENRSFKYGMIIFAFGFTGLFFLISWMFGKGEFSLLPILFIIMALYTIWDGWKEFRDGGEGR